MLHSTKNSGKNLEKMKVHEAQFLSKLKRCLRKLKVLTVGIVWRICINLVAYAYILRKNWKASPFNCVVLLVWNNGKHRYFCIFNGLSIFQCMPALKFCLASWPAGLDISNEVQNPLMMESLFHLRPAFKL